MSLQIVTKSIIIHNSYYPYINLIPMNPEAANNQQKAQQQSGQKLDQNLQKKKIQQKSKGISFLKIGYCHMCRNKGRLVYQCYKLYSATACDKRYCVDCLLIIYKQNIIDIVQTQDNWKCPFAKKVCRCKPCCMIRKETETVLDFDGTLPVICALKGRQGGDEDSDESEVDETMKCILKEKFKRLIDFNGTLLSKFSTNQAKLNQTEIEFYNSVLHSNLLVLRNLSKNMLEYDQVVDQ